MILSMLKFGFLVVIGTALACLPQAVQASSNQCNDGGGTLVKVLLGNFADGEAPSWTPNGTGVPLTADGYVLTAFHVVDGYLEVGLQFPALRTGGLFLASVKANVIDVNPYLDAALLKAQIPAGLRLEPARIGSPSSTEAPDGLCIGGYGIIRQAESNANLTTYVSEDLEYDYLAVRRQSHGYVFLEGQIKHGFSGGGAYWNDLLFGISIQRGKFGSRILPASKIRSFLVRNGLGVERDGRVIALADMEGIARQVRNNRETITRILTDVDWDAEFPLLDGETENKSLRIFFEKKLPMQNVVGFLLARATPIFDDPNFEAWHVAKGSELAFPINGDLLEGSITDENVVDDIRAVIIEYEDETGFQLEINSLEGLHIEGQVKRVAGGESLPGFSIFVGRSDR